jgi:hypothetical protein
MKKKVFWKSYQNVIVLLSFLYLSNLVLNAQSVEADFLLFSPSPVVTGMGGAEAALPSDDPYNFFYNPAQLGLNNENTNLSIGIYPSSVNVSSLSNVLFNNFAVHGGYDCSKLLGGLPLSLGAGFLYQKIDFGEFLRTTDSGYVLGVVHPYEKATTFSLGFGFNYFIKIAGGISYKLIRSDMSGYTIPNKMFFFTKGNADAFDLGILAELPILTSMPITENLSLNLSASAGYTFANWGSYMVYNLGSGSPIARTARLGYGLSTGIDYKIKETKIKLVKIDWTSEANDLLVKNVLISNPPDTIYTQGYKPPLGDINFWDNVIMLKNTSTSAVNRYGVKISFFETADIELGRYEIPNIYNKMKGSTLGISISTKGIMKIISQEIENNILEFIAKHISLQYSYSGIKFDEYNDNLGYNYPSYEQSYNALYLTFSGF